MQTLTKSEALIILLFDQLTFKSRLGKYTFAAFRFSDQGNLVWSDLAQNFSDFVVGSDGTVS